MRLPRLAPCFIPAVDRSFVDVIGQNPYFVIFPGAGVKQRQWPAVNFLNIAEKLQRATGWRAVICGSSIDSPLAAFICSNSPLPMVDWTGRSSVSQMTAIIAGCRLLVSNETSAIHIAAILGVPSVCILGGGHYGRFLPYRIEGEEDRPLPRCVTHSMPCFSCNWNCIYSPEPDVPPPCILEISSDDVWQEIREILELR